MCSVNLFFCVSEHLEKGLEKKEEEKKTKKRSRRHELTKWNSSNPSKENAHRVAAVRVQTKRRKR